MCGQGGRAELGLGLGSVVCHLHGSSKLVSISGLVGIGNSAGLCVGNRLCWCRRNIRGLHCGDSGYFLAGCIAIQMAVRGLLHLSVWEEVTVVTGLVVSALGPRPFRIQPMRDLASPFAHDLHQFSLHPGKSLYSGPWPQPSLGLFILVSWSAFE